MKIWAFGISPYGLGLTEDTLWGLCQREYHALTEVRDHHLELQFRLVSGLRADLHNTSGHFERVFQPAEFMPGNSIETVEDRARKLIAEGIPPARAVAMAHSTQDRAERATIIQTTLESSRLRAAKGGKRRMKPAG